MVDWDHVGSWWTDRFYRVLFCLDNAVFFFADTHSLALASFYAGILGVLYLYILRYSSFTVFVCVSEFLWPYFYPNRLIDFGILYSTVPGLLMGLLLLRVYRWGWRWQGSYAKSMLQKTVSFIGIRPLNVHQSTRTRILLAAWIPRRKLRE
jgi:hypothetical protein